MKVLVTGAAGFIGFHSARRLLGLGFEVLGVDSLDPYYDVGLKERRLAMLRGPGFAFARLDLSDPVAAASFFRGRCRGVEYVLHLAAQAGVRHSISHPMAYSSANLVGHLNVLEGCRGLRGLRHLVYASSSSVYGTNPGKPLSEGDDVRSPGSLYAATKLADEAMSHAYSHLYGFPSTGVRFFTVYGPWGRPDMAVWDFCRRIVEGRRVVLYGGPDGELRRDFTHVDDVVSGVVAALREPPPSHRVVNLGRGRPEPVSSLVSLLEDALGRRARLVIRPRPAADVLSTWADVSLARRLFGYDPVIDLSEGVPAFARWYRSERTGT